VAGFFAGAKGAGLFLSSCRDNRRFLAADSIMAKRMQAMQASKKSGKSAYEFKVKAPYPILGN